MWIATVEINGDGGQLLRTFTSSARDEKQARKSVLRRGLAIGRVHFPAAKSLECSIVDFRPDEPNEFRIF